ncbi:WD40 repeat-like protein [Backusella circina FSU 941]|nr:WD40 repeat-like protein [Backusella circina FSU 941]
MKTRRRVSYVVSLSNNQQAHCLGINSLAIDSSRDGNVLYSAGRDGIVASWDLHLNNNEMGVEEKASVPKSTCKAFSQMHTDWVNDIVLCDQGNCVVSASSDRTIKLWKPFSDTATKTHTIGYHTDYAKCLTYASKPGWVASGGLDRRIILWDIEKSEAMLTMDSGPTHHVTDGPTENTNMTSSSSSKCSIYALAVNPSGTLLASGTPEKVVRLWDPRSGKRISKLTGHTDNIRALLISDDGNYVLSGSSDSTIKLWSVKAQRCLTTYETHPDSVWSLYSNDPNLKTFYSGSRDGLVNKTQVSGLADDDGESECIALCKENSGVLKIAALEDSYIWTATSSSSINRWLSVPNRESRQVLTRSDYNIDIPTSALVQLPPQPGVYFPQASDSYIAGSDSLTLYAGSVLSIPISYQEDDQDEDEELTPLRSTPDCVIEGKPGITSHTILRDRRLLLTKDTNGEITLWDLTKCKQVKNYGKGDLEQVTEKINIMESFPAWCSVDTKIGAITVQLHGSNCFDCEMYEDELDLPKGYDIKEDQRVNLGKWVLVHLFNNFIKKEIESDTVRYTDDEPSKINSDNNPTNNNNKPRPVDEKSTESHNGFIPQYITIPPAMNADNPKPPSLAVTSENANNNNPFLPSSNQPNNQLNGPYTAPPTTGGSQPDYFSGSHHNRRDSSVQLPPPAAMPVSPTASTSSNFMHRLKSLSVKAKLSRTLSHEDRVKEAEGKQNDTTKVTQPVQDDTSNTSSSQSKLDEIAEEDKTVEKYDPPMLDEYPPLEIPSSAMILIAEESAEASTGMDLYRGSVGSTGDDADTIIDVAPSWLLSYLLYNKTPIKEPVKLTFILKPANGSSLEELPGGSNNRLVASRILRVKKLIQYVCEKIQIEDEESIEMMCGETILGANMTLATIKQYILKVSGDIPLSYRLKNETITVE